MLDRRSGSAPARGQSVRARMRTFEQALRERGLRSTSQRDDIARVFFGAERHLSIEELYTAVKKVNPRVGYATVYRTLKLLKECDLAAERHFDDGQARFEAVRGQAQPHPPSIGGGPGARAPKGIGRSSSSVSAIMELRHCADCRSGKASAPARAGRPPGGGLPGRYSLGAVPY